MLLLIIIIMTTNRKDMNSILNKVHEFARWAGMELCVHKCEVAGYDFRTGRELSTRKIRYNCQRMPNLTATTAVRYLGLRLDITGSTKGEKEHITERMQDAKRRLKTHKYTHRQAFSLLNTVIRPVFAYSTAMTAWTHKELWHIQQDWSIMGRYAWGLPNSHNEAPFLLPPERSGVMTISPYITAAKSTLQLLNKTCNTITGETKRLILGEWNNLRTKWGTGDTHVIQSAIILEDTPHTNRTLLSNTLKYLGWVGICPYWASLPGCKQPAQYNPQEPHETRTIWSGLWRYIRHSLTVRWDTGEGTKRNENLASRLQKLVTKGTTTIAKLKHPVTKDWWIDNDCTRSERQVLYQGLEHCFPGTKRHTIKQDINTAATRCQPRERQTYTTTEFTEGPETVINITDDTDSGKDKDRAHQHEEDN